jgi:integrase
MACVIRRKYRGPDGKLRTCRNYTIQWRDAAGQIRRMDGGPDKGAAKQRAAAMEKALARGETGMINPFKVHKARALADHLKEYVADLRATGRDDMYCYNAERRLTILADGCGWKSLGDVESNSFLRWRESQRAADSTRRGRMGAKASAATLNQYLDTARAFTNWCAQNGRMEGVPVRGKLVALALASVAKVEGPKVRQRRALTDEQVSALLAAATAERRIVYRVAIATGLRRAELEALQWGDVQLNAIRPYIQLRAEATKARRGDRLELQQSLAADLRTHKPEGAKDAHNVFPDGVPDIEQWRADLAAAGIPYKDGMGRQADFHGGSRKTMASRMHRAGVPLAVAMRRMRHTDAKLTLVDYCDDGAIGMEQGLLPELPVLAAAVPVAAVAGA